MKLLVFLKVPLLSATAEKGDSVLLFLIAIVIVCSVLFAREISKRRKAAAEEAQQKAQIEAFRRQLAIEKNREAEAAWREKKRLEAERLEKERQEQERLEAERLEKEHLEQKRKEQERIAAEAEAQRRAEPKAYEVAGVQYYLKNLLSMMEPNYLYAYKKQDLIDTCNYDRPIYKTACTATKLELVQEDDNPNDPNAVVVLLNQRIVGYIPRKECKHIRHLMDNDLIESFSCEVYGGKYKQVNEDYDWEKDKSTYSMETGEDEYGITIFIKEKLE